MIKKNYTQFAIIVCRLDSSRFKKKALKKFKKKTIIEYLIDNISSTNIIKRKNIIISTSRNKEDDQLVQIAKKLNVRIFRGSKKNIINRIFNTFKKFKIPSAVITSADNPFFLPDVYESIKELNKYSVKYITNLPVGLNLLSCDYKAISIINKHNLTKNNENGFYLYFTNTNLFKKKLVKFKIKNILKNTRFTIDYPNDFLFFKSVIKYLSINKFKNNLKNIEKIIKKNQKIKNINLKQNFMYKKNLKQNTNIYYLDKKNKKINLPYV